VTDETPEERRAMRGMDRMVFFSDAVVAIAITLVVLPLVDEVGSIGDKTVGEFFVENIYGFGAAALSFYAIARFWMVHHGMFVRAIGYTRWLVHANMLWLAGIVFLPLATVLDVKPTHGIGGAILYIATLAYIMATARLVEFILIREDLLDDHERRSARQEAAEWTPVAILVVAIIVTVIVPSVGLYSLFLLVVSGAVRRIVSGRRERTLHIDHAA
jgi:uncharacterized membrane protein